MVATLLANNSQHCWMLHVASVSLRSRRYCRGVRLKFWRQSCDPKKGVGTRRQISLDYYTIPPATQAMRPFAHHVACCRVLLGVVVQSSKAVKRLSQQPPTFLLFRDRRSIAQQCWNRIRLHSSSNIVGATHMHSTWFTTSYGLYPSHDALQVPTLSVAFASVCAPLPTF